MPTDCQCAPAAAGEQECLTQLHCKCYSFHSPINLMQSQQGRFFGVFPADVEPHRLSVSFSPLPTNVMAAKYIGP